MIALLDRASDDDAANQNIIADANPAASREIGRRRVELVSELVAFDQGDALGAIRPAHDRGVIAGRESDDKRRLERVARDQAGGLISATCAPFASYRFA